MDDNPGYLYTLEAKIVENSLGEVTVSDVYRQKIGFRKLTWDNTNLYINNRVKYNQ